MKTHLVLGPPGTGKTTALLSIVSREIESGVEPDRLAFLGFTKKSVEEARVRCDLNDPAYFRTIHSFCYRALIAHREQMCTDKLIRMFCQQNALTYTGSQNGPIAGMFAGDGSGNTVLSVLDIMQHTKRNLEDAYRFVDPLNMSLQQTEKYIEKYLAFKDDFGVYSYSDLLEEFCLYGMCPELDVLVVDEAQDLTSLQWDVIRHIARSAAPQRVYVAGDDDQTIYAWAGADVKHFNEIEFDSIEVLGQSYRVPKKVQEVALKVIEKVENRRLKEWAPRGEDGEIRYVSDLDHVPFDKGEWLVLSRNRCFLNKVAEILDSYGYLYRYGKNWSVKREYIVAAYFWEKYTETRHSDDFDRAMCAMSKEQRIELESMEPRGVSWEKALDLLSPYEQVVIRKCLKRKDVLKVVPRITLSTIHATKGGEADNVLLITDMTRGSYSAIEKGGDFEDNERRAVYVGVTRAKKTLNLIHLGSPYTFEELLL